MTATYDSIATTTLGSTTTNITFSSIPGTYTDLRVVVVGVPTAGENPRIRYNSSTGPYAYVRATSTGSAFTSIYESGRNSLGLANDAFTPSTTLPVFSAINIFSYAGNRRKAALISTSEDYNGSGIVEVRVGTWENTAAITSVNLFYLSGGSWNIGTTATLYGIKAE
jgi:hypothetical protein